MTDVDQKNALLAGDPTVADETEEVPTHAGPVVVRGLTRGEALALGQLRDAGEMTVAEYEQHMVSTAMISPKMTPAEVAKWQTVDQAGGPLGDVTDTIARLSKLSEGANKSGVRRARRKPRS